MYNTIEEIMRRYNELKEQLGHLPSSRNFHASTGISKRTLDKLFGSNSFSQLVKKCGDEPHKFLSHKTSLESILIEWGKLTRKCKKLPTISDWEHNNCRPTINSITRSHKLKWAQIPNKFYEYAITKPEWKDVVEIIPPITNNKKEFQDNQSEECYVYLMIDTKNNFYKIGISNNAVYRKKTLQSEKPTIKLIASKKFINRRIAANFEKALHDSYSHKRKRGEWFILDPEEIQEIKQTLED